MRPFGRSPAPSAVDPRLGCHCPIRRGRVRGRLAGQAGLLAPIHLAQRIADQVANVVIEVDGTRLTLACSIGAAVSEPCDDTVLTLIERADRALYHAKADGRGQIRWHQSDLARSD